MLHRVLPFLCACSIAGCSVFPDSPPQIGTPQDAGEDTDAEVLDAPVEGDVAAEADAAQEHDGPVEADALEEADAPDDVSETGDADDAADAADAIESGDVQSDAPDHCYDTETNFDETDLNCGGAACPKCTKGKSCLVADDCESGICNPGKKCN